MSNKCTFGYFADMVHTCIVPGCPNRSNKPKSKRLRFYTLPSINKVKEIWLSLIGRSFTEVTLHSRICSEHFINGKKTKDSIPEIFPWQKRTTTSTTTEATSTIIQESHPTLILESHPSPSLSPSNIVDHDHCYCKPYQLQLSPTHLTPVTEQLVSLPPSSSNVNSVSPFCIEKITNNDDAIHFYTGFSNFKMLKICYEYLGPSVYHLKYWGSNSKASSVESRGTPRAMTPLNEFFLFFCRVRCSLMEKDLAFRFQISQSTVSRIFITWINFLYFKFKDIPIWPSKHQVNHFMPPLFKEFYPSTRCIIDATELFIQSPSNPQAQQLTFSSYKNHNTFKALVCITPSGAISFVSKLHGGSISDRELFQKSALIDLLETGDSVMADRGFTIADILHEKGIILKIPPMKVTNQLTDREIVTTRRIAALRIHVERAIGRVKNFRILNDIPNNMSRIADQIFFVCCMLCNFLPPLSCK